MRSGGRSAVILAYERAALQLRAMIAESCVVHRWPCNNGYLFGDRKRQHWNSQGRVGYTAYNNEDVKVAKGLAHGKRIRQRQFVLPYGLASIPGKRKCCVKKQTVCGSHRIGEAFFTGLGTPLLRGGDDSQRLGTEFGEQKGVTSDDE